MPLFASMKEARDFLCSDIKNHCKGGQERLSLSAQMRSDLSDMTYLQLSEAVLNGQEAVESS